MSCYILHTFNVSYSKVWYSFLFYYVLLILLYWVLLLAFLVFIFFLYSLEIIARSVASSQQRFEFWLLNALSSPLSGTFIPLALLIAIQLPISSTIFGIQHKQQRRSHRESESKTINESDSSLDTPYTHWSSPHSFCDISLPDELQQDWFIAGMHTQRLTSWSN